jgi:glyoxylase-like metal-dependent hydrolase (beta-lactamase superfamily II)
MLRLQQFVYNAFSENTYLVINEKSACWVVDPGMYSAEELTSFKQYLSSENLILQGIINTHAHIDHIFGVTALTDAYQIPFGLHENDMPVLQGAKGAAMLFGFNLSTIPQPTHFIKAGEPLMLDKDELDVRLTPGHSPGSISFYSKEGKWVICGDVLFAGSIGRTDLPGGHHDTLISSIKSQLLTLPDDTTIYPGHGPATAIGRERVTNPFLQ